LRGPRRYLRREVDRVETTRYVTGLPISLPSGELRIKWSRVFETVLRPKVRAPLNPLTMPIPSRSPQRASSLPRFSRQRSMVRAEMPTIRQAGAKRAPARCASMIAESITSRSARRCRRPRVGSGSRSFFSTSSVAASASAFSLRANSRSSLRIRLAVARDPCPSSFSATRQRSNSATSMRTECYLRCDHRLRVKAVAAAATAVESESGSTSFNRLTCNSPARSSTG
jgi:hypothetical protein